MADAGGWDGLIAITHEAADLKRQEDERDPAACFDCGEPLRTGPNGERYCSFDGSTWEAGNRRTGQTSATHN